MEPHDHLQYLGYLVELGVTGFLSNRVITALSRAMGSTTLDSLVNTPAKAAATAAVTAYPIVNAIEYLIR